MIFSSNDSKTHHTLFDGFVHIISVCFALYDEDVCAIGISIMPALLHTETLLMTKKSDKPKPRGIKTRRISCSPRNRVQSSKTGDYLGSRHWCILPPETSQGGLSINPTLAAACRSRVTKAATSVLVSFLVLRDFSCCYCWHCWDGERERFLQIALLHHSLHCLLLPTGAMATTAQTTMEMCKEAPT